MAIATATATAAPTRPRSQLFRADDSNHEPPFTSPTNPANHAWLAAHMHLQPRQTTGAVRFLNPTRARFRHYRSTDDRPRPRPRPAPAPRPSTVPSTPSPSARTMPDEGADNDDPGRDDDAHAPAHQAHDACREPKRHRRASHVIGLRWRSRDDRKGRHSLVVSAATAANRRQSHTPSPTNRLRPILHGIVRLATHFPYWDISWLVAVLFTLGSVVWCVNGSVVYVPLVGPGPGEAGVSGVAAGVTAFVGATVFEVGSVLMMVEALNANPKRGACFGWALRRVLQRGVGVGHDDDADDGMRWVPDEEGCAHHHVRKRKWCTRRRTGTGPDASSSSADSSPSPSWIWLPSWSALRTHYLHEIGFLASLVQLLGASIFWISGLTALPHVLDMTDARPANKRLVDGVYWSPQVVGGMGFVVSGVLFLLETQPVWYRPAWRVLGWHIAWWNLVGGVGFTLSGALGYCSFSSSRCLYQSSLATFWGSWAFLIGSVLQWYESLDKHPVVVDDDDEDEDEDEDGEGEGEGEGEVGGDGDEKESGEGVGDGDGGLGEKRKEVV
ncbi:MAG: hypothetical protein M1826_001343 [Phylliscum demangeonii]|nr:MAG: hypothetical protein M1826_001343 [Phylliscum demangeonii]